MFVRMNLADLLEGAGLSELIGSSKYSWRVQRIMSKKSPEYKKSEAIEPKPSFRYEMVENKSPFIQRKYGPDDVEEKPFDHCKAQKRREALSEEDKLWEAVHKPEYWGLRWAERGATGGDADELVATSNGGVGVNYVNSDGLRFPPEKYEFDGKTYWALPYIGGEPKGMTRKYDAKQGKTVQKNRQRVRRTMLFFRSDSMPNFTHLPEFSSAAAYERGKGFTYSGVVLRKTYNGIELIGTDRVMAKGKKGDTKPEVAESPPPPVLQDAVEEPPVEEPVKKIKIKRKKEETPEEELARVKAAFDNWRFNSGELTPEESHAAQVRARNYMGEHDRSPYKGDRKMSDADAYRKAATTGKQKSKLVIP